jgi:type IV pilus assembly protein PilC
MSETYAYKVRDTGGKLVSGTLVADNQQLVVSRLREMGYIPLTVGLQKQGVKREFHFSNKVKLKDLSLFSRQFSTMVNSGLPILKCLSILQEQTDSAVLQKTVVELGLEIERGSSLSDSMGKFPKVFDNLYVAMIRSGEAAGVLEAVLERLSMNLEKEVALRQRIKAAMTYPIVVVGFVGMILAAMLLFIVPQFKTIYGSLGGTLPLPTLILLKVSDILKSDFIIVAVLTAIFVYAFKRFKKTPRGHDLWDRAKLRAPIFGPLVQKTALARFSRTLAVLSKSGVPILQALDVVGETVNNTVIARAVKDVQESVKQGDSLAKPLSKYKVFPPMTVQMLAVGEETGALDTMLDKVAQFYDEEVTAAVDSLTAIIEPAMIFLVGGMVGLAVIALYMPMFNIIKLIK